MKIPAKEFRVREGASVRLKRLPTKVKPFYQSDEDYKKILAGHIRDLTERQSLLYAHNR